MDCQDLDKIGETITGLRTEHVWALSIKTRELISTRKRFSKLYKITLAFKSRQGVDRFIRWGQLALAEIHRSGGVWETKVDCQFV